MSLGEAITGTIASTAIGAAFGAMGAKGTGAFKGSSKIAGDGIRDITTLLKSGVLPAVKSGARATTRVMFLRP